MDKSMLSIACLFGLSISYWPVVAEESRPAPYEIIAELEHGPGNVAVGPTGRIIFSLHQMYSPDINVMELMADGTTRPYPSEAWARPPKGEEELGTHAVLGVVIDQNQTLWLLDNASSPPRLIAWDMKNERLKRIYPLSSGSYTPKNTMINDLAVNLSDKKVYIADIFGDQGAGLIVVDIQTGDVRTVLRGHKSTSAELDSDLIIGGRGLRMKTDAEIITPKIGVNPITIDSQNKYVYYGAMHGTSIYRIPTSALNDETLSPSQLKKTIERFGDKPVSDGISIDEAGNVYVTDLQGYGIGVTAPNGKYRRLFTDRDTFIWPDGLSTAPKGTIVGTINQLNRSAPLNAGYDESKPPFYIYRFNAIADVKIGR